MPSLRPRRWRPSPRPRRRPPPHRDLQQLAELKRQVDELRPVVAGRLAGLEKRSAGTWGGAQFARGKQRLAAADVASGSREYGVALARLREADADLKAVEQRVDATLRAALAAGFAAVESGDAAAARRQFDVALAIDSSNAAAKRGLRRLDTLDEVRRLLAEAAEQERNGQAAAATATYRKALALDPDTVAARSALGRLEAQATGDAFGAAIADALAALSRKDYAAARAPTSVPGASVREHPRSARDSSRWSARSAIAASARTSTPRRRPSARSAGATRSSSIARRCKIDAKLLAAQQGVERAEPRAMLDAELASYLERPERRVLERHARRRARDARAGGRGPEPGAGAFAPDRPSSAICVAAAETPVRLAIASDNQTDVIIYRVGKLGAFERKDMDLLPGPLYDRRHADGLPRRATRGHDRARTRAAGTRDPLRGADLNVELVLREPLGERSFAAADFPLSIGGAGSDVVVPAPCSRADRVARAAGRAALRAARGRRSERAPQRFADHGVRRGCAAATCSTWAAAA